MLNFDPPVVKRSRWMQICNRLGVVVRGRKRLDGFTKLVIVVVAAVLIPKIGSTFAGSITLNGDQSVEFGQGTVMTTACDESITITPTSSFNTVAKNFDLGEITVSGLDASACYADMFTITVFDGKGVPIDICEENDGDENYTSNALQLAYRDSIDSWVLISDCFFDQSPRGSEGSSTGFVFVPSNDIDSSRVSSISIESALSTTADDWNQAVELNRSNTGTINVSTTNATLEEGEGHYEDEYNSWEFTNTVWFRWNATQDGNLTIDTCDSEIDTVLQAFDESWSSIAADDSGAWGTCNNGGQNDPSELSFDVQSGSTYLIQLGGWVDGPWDESGLAQLNWDFEAGAIIYSVTYDGNTSTSGAVPSDGTSYSSSAVVTVASNSGTLAKTGYTFDGWCTTQSAAGAVCSGTSQAVPSTFTITGDTTLYAQWAGNSLTVTLVEQGGNTISDASTTSGGSMSDPGTPTRTGYDFDGWFVASTGGSAITFPYAHGQTADFTLYAQWVETALYRVGDPGPGGGTIFYVNMRSAAGSQYFEAACAGWTHNCDDVTADPYAQWDWLCGSIDGADGMVIGFGEQNTADILAGCATPNNAARLADAYTVTEDSVVYGDWFLPSQDELYQMRVEQVSVGGFSSNGYWSSSEYDFERAWYQMFGDLISYNRFGKYNSLRVRPVRSF